MCKFFPYKIHLNNPQPLLRCRFSSFAMSGILQTDAGPNIIVRLG